MILNYPVCTTALEVLFPYQFASSTTLRDYAFVAWTENALRDIYIYVQTSVETSVPCRHGDWILTFAPNMLGSSAWDLYGVIHSTYMRSWCGWEILYFFFFFFFCSRVQYRWINEENDVKVFVIKGVSWWRYYISKRLNVNRWKWSQLSCLQFGDVGTGTVSSWLDRMSLVPVIAYWSSRMPSVSLL
jgi:hypothetical protein